MKTPGNFITDSVDALLRESAIPPEDPYGSLTTHGRPAPKIAHAVQAAKKEAELALGRIKKAMQYGPDMASSPIIGYEDAISLLQKALDILKKAGIKT